MEELPSDRLHFITDVLKSTSLEEDRIKYTEFAQYLVDWIQEYGHGRFEDSLIRKYKFYELYKNFLLKKGYEIVANQKDTSLELHGYWVIFFRVMRNSIPMPHNNVFKFKYETEADFLREYQYHFIDCEPEELTKLFFTANWMSILFCTVDARGNKGLAMSVIPKLIEGFHAKYSTGGGQSQSTGNRVRIYEHEGNVKAHERPTRRVSLNNLAFPSFMMRTEESFTAPPPLPHFKRSVSHDAPTLNFPMSITTLEMHRIPLKRAATTIYPASEPVKQRMSVESDSSYFSETFQPNISTINKST